MPQEKISTTEAEVLFYGGWVLGIGGGHGQGHDVRTIGVPWEPDFAIGCLTCGHEWSVPKLSRMDSRPF